MECLHAWETGKVRILILTAGHLSYPFPRVEALVLKVGTAPGREQLSCSLARMGYQKTSMVSEKGETASRGFILDVFSPQMDLPVRAELEGDTVASLRTFNPSDQRSRENLEEAVFLPIRFFPVKDPAKTAEFLRGRIRGRGGEKLLEEAEQSAGFQTLEFFMAGRTPLRGPGPRMALDWERIRAKWREHFDMLASEGREAAETGYLDLPAEEFFVSPEEGAYDPGTRFNRLASGASGERTIKLRGVGIVPGNLPTFGREYRDLLGTGFRIVLWLKHPSHRKGLSAYLQEQGLPLPEFEEGPLPEHLVFEELSLALLSSSRILGEPPAPPRLPSVRSLMPDLDDFKVGERIVQAEHGIGLYQGLHAMGGEEFIKIKFADGDIYIPMHRIDTVSRYRGSGGQLPPLDRIGSNAFHRRKRKAKKALKSMVGELLNLYAMRKISPGHAFGAYTPLQDDLEDAFPYEETPDQARTWDEVKTDMEAPVPMDRLVCGDVGFGKTEIAIRAAFKAVQDGLQAAILCPTTLLAFQHHRTFSERLAGLPVTVAWLSRFIPKAEQKAVVERVKAGRVDILIGTHRLLSQDVDYARLGLLIIDEEQRFGVAQKEKVRQMKKTVDTLTLTATPIPRTFNMALLGLKDMSLILTPPLGRFSVETSIVPYNPVFLRDVIRFELQRGGQVFFLHNRVERLEEVHAYLSALVPEGRFTVTHGQMSEHTLERNMLAFIRGEADVLLTTTIIENGIDIPHANTLIVNNAHTFGLAQLYQLRGRVGRSDRQAFCYLVVPSVDTISQGAMDRLLALEEFTALGAGFRVAAKDLEIRGAGDLLGREQSGNVDALGYDLYMRLLERTVQEMKGVPELQEEVELHLDLHVQIPPAYIPQEELRLKVYRQLLTSPLEELESSLRDQFGPPPPEVLTLLAAGRIRRAMQRLKIREVQKHRDLLVFRIDPSTSVPLEQWIDVARRFPQSHFTPEGALKIRQDREGEHLVYWLDDFLKSL
jgi:transcription-repair coupling factor (superfamily II helicase)